MNVESHVDLVLVMVYCLLRFYDTTDEEIGEALNFATRDC